MAVYVVMGSEDGILTVTYGLKRAVKLATEYVAAGNDIREVDVCLEGDKHYYRLSASESAWASATVERFEVQ